MHPSVYVCIPIYSSLYVHLYLSICRNINHLATNIYIYIYMCIYIESHMVLTTRRAACRSPQQRGLCVQPPAPWPIERGPSARQVCPERAQAYGNHDGACHDAAADDDDDDDDDDDESEKTQSLCYIHACMHACITWSRTWIDADMHAYIH